MAIAMPLQLFRLGNWRVYSLVSYQKGVLAGCDAGLMRIEGKNFQPRRISTEIAMAMLPHLDGVYIASWMQDGLLRLTPQNRFEALGYPKVVEYDRGLVRMVDLALWDNSIVVACQAGAYAFDLAQKQWRIVMADADIEHAASHQDKLYLSTLSHEMHYVANPKSKPVRVKESLSGRLWVDQHGVIEAKFVGNRVDFRRMRQPNKPLAKWSAPLKGGPHMSLAATAWLPVKHGYLIGFSAWGGIGAIVHANEAMNKGTRIAQDIDVQCMAQSGDWLWVGAESGLFRAKLPAEWKL